MILPDPLYKRVQNIAKENKTTVSAIVRNFLETYKGEDKISEFERRLEALEKDVSELKTKK